MRPVIQNASEVCMKPFLFFYFAPRTPHTAHSTPFLSVVCQSTPSIHRRFRSHHHHEAGTEPLLPLRVLCRVSELRHEYN